LLITLLLIGWIPFHNAIENGSTTPIKRYAAYACIMAKRLRISLAIGVVAGALCPLLDTHIAELPIDFMWSLFAARDLLGGHDVYATPSSRDIIPYPLTAAIAGIPFSWMPMTLAASIFMGTSSALLAFGLTRDGQWWRLLVFLSAPYYLAVRSVQWSPLLMAVACFPALMPLVLVKPQYVIPVALPRLTYRRVTACVCFGLLSIAIDPTWPIRWVTKLGPYGGFVPILACPALAILALRWRDRDARQLILMSCMPQQTYLYDSLLVWLTPSSLREMMFLTFASWPACMAGMFWVGFREQGSTLTVISIYIPAMLIVLRRGIATEARKPYAAALESQHSCGSILQPQ
jgi:hypothetical protein